MVGSETHLVGNQMFMTDLQPRFVIFCAGIMNSGKLGRANFEMNDGLWVISFSCEIVALFALRIESDVRCLEFQGTYQ